MNDDLSEGARALAVGGFAFGERSVLREAYPGRRERELRELSLAGLVTQRVACPTRREVEYRGTDGTKAMYEAECRKRLLL